MKKYKRALRIILPVFLILYLGALFYLATSTSLPDLSSLKQFDKIIHFIEFFVLIILLLFTFAVYGFDDYRILSLAVAFIIIVASEVIQLPIVSRSFSELDIVADLTGVFLGYIILYGVDFKWNLLKQFS